MRFQWHKLDIRIPLFGLLLIYTVLGLTVLGFNRSPLQALITVACASLLDFVLNALIRKDRPAIPWSGMITGLGLCLLLNYGSNFWLPVVPAFLAIASKHLFTFRNNHVYNPTLFGLIAGMFFTDGLLSPSPAYQWGGSLAMALFVLTAALFVFANKINRKPLMLAFLGFYTVQMLVRCYVMRHHLPWEAIVFGTVTSAPFYLFTFYMLTDPKTSPESPRSQVLFALSVVCVDLYFHTQQAYSTLFPALFTVQSAILIFRHGQAILNDGLMPRMHAFQSRFVNFNQAVLLVLAVVVILLNKAPQKSSSEHAGMVFTPVSSEASGMTSSLSNILDTVDPGVVHMAKWILSVGDAVAVADVNNDGLQDIFLTNTLKQKHERASLYLNQGHLQFKAYDISDLEELRNHPEHHGLAACALFADYDNDGDQDLFIGVGFGQSRLLKNELSETGHLSFVDVTEQAGIQAHTTCLAAVWFDYNQDGLLDLLVGNSVTPYLPDYDRPTKLNLFKLPEPEFKGDRRMFHFMHSSWHRAENGGLNLLYKNEGNGQFSKIDAAAIGMPETHWTLAINTADFNQDGWPDIYCASDFGPDDIYMNQQGQSFQRISGLSFGSIGKDTYKGMNVSLADFDRNGFTDVYVSNVHAPLQAEGSMLWLTYPSSNQMRPHFKNKAAALGALNEHRFGWGACAGDVNNDGWPDIVQANGMVDDSFDKKFNNPHDYWYINARLARTGPEVHAYIDQWADIRGYSIFGQQQNRVLLNYQGEYFEDRAVEVGLSEAGNSRGVALADFDNDGDLDLIITHQFKSVSLYRNDPTQDRHSRNWIGFQLQGDGVSCSRDAVHAVVTLESQATEGYWIQRVELSRVAGFSSQSDSRIFFGLASCNDPLNVTIKWPSGLVEKYQNVVPNHYHEICQGSDDIVTHLPSIALSHR